VLTADRVREAIAMMLDASDVVVTHCPYCHREVDLRADHWRDNPGDHPGGYWDCAYWPLRARLGALRKPERCPTCTSKAPSLHPAVQWEGEVHLCPDLWHDDPVTAKARAAVAGG
jgi:hypothetical protein